MVLAVMQAPASAPVAHTDSDAPATNSESERALIPAAVPMTFARVADLCLSASDRASGDADAVADKLLPAMTEDLIGLIIDPIFPPPQPVDQANNQFERIYQGEKRF